MKNLFDRQKRFNDLFFNEKELDKIQKEEITRSLSLALHAEVSDMISAINFKDHREERLEIDIEKIVYESVDAFRYILAIMNLWEITPQKFLECFDDKDLFLHARHASNKKKWKAQPVLIVDIDDVLAKFRDGFNTWLEETYNIDIDHQSSEYYTTSEVKEAGLNPETVFDRFISERHLANLVPCEKMIKVINSLHHSGYWIHLLTARPQARHVCFYDTYRWLDKVNLHYDRLSFSPEKYRWLTKTDYFDSEKVICAIDDSPKHAAEYAKHGIKVLVPKEIYNTEVHEMENVILYQESSDVVAIVKSLCT